MTNNTSSRPILLCTVGTSPMVVPEAFYLYKENFASVRLFTGDSSTMNSSLEELHPFFSAHPTVDFSITRVNGFSDLQDQREHDLFEEALARWYLESVATAQPLYVCISGGFKSMSAGLQKMAHLFGAAEVFHVLADDPRSIQTLQDLKRELANDRVRTITIGSESGWSVLKSLSTEDYPLNVTSQHDDITRYVSSHGPSLRSNTANLLRQISQRADGWDRLGESPFASLAILDPSVHHWLDEPLDPKQDADWIRSLPKTELHCHLGGIATHGEPLQRVRKEAEDPDALPPLSLFASPPAGWPLPDAPCPLDRYMRLGDANGSALLKDIGCLRQQVQECYALLRANHVAYAEIRCSPANYSSPKHTPRAILEVIRQEFLRCRQRVPANELSPIVNLIVIVTRRDSGDLSTISRHLALAVDASADTGDPLEGCRVVAVDLAGFENPSTRPQYFEADFNIAHRCGLAVTAHAGENDDVESIWQAVYRLHARRLGHALKLTQSSDLIRVVADRHIGIEMCPYANYQIHGFAPMPGKESASYPLRAYLNDGIKVSVNTDNPGISDADLTANYLLLPQLCPGITRREILQLIRNGFDTAFISKDLRTNIMNQIEPIIAKICQNKAQGHSLQ